MARSLTSFPRPASCFPLSSSYLNNFSPRVKLSSTLGFSCLWHCDFFVVSSSTCYIPVFFFSSFPQLLFPHLLFPSLCLWLHFLSLPSPPSLVLVVCNSILCMCVCLYVCVYLCVCIFGRYHFLTPHLSCSSAHSPFIFSYPTSSSSSSLILSSY